MPVSIEFQIAGFITTFIILIAFLKKVRWYSPQNTIYRILLIITLLELALDITSVILIDHRDLYPALNNFFGKAYLIAMLGYIYTIDLYSISITFYKGIPERRKKIKFAIIILLTLFMLTVIALILLNTLYYAGYGRGIYSYGFPSDLIYLFSSFSVVFVILILLINIRHVEITKMLSILSFCVMEGTIAIVQMFNKELLLVGFGSAVTVFIMYFAVENPDSQAISRLSQANKRARELVRNFSLTAAKGRPFDINTISSRIFSDATVLYMEITDFQSYANRMGLERLTKYITSIFEKIDSTTNAFNLEKINSVGTEYITVAGIPDENHSNAFETIHFALEIQNIIRKTNSANGMNLQVRIGIANGPILAGLVGKQNFVYNIWGQPVLLADMLKSRTEANRIHVSASVYEKLRELYKFSELPESDYEGIGKVKTYLLENRDGGGTHSSRL